MPKDISKPKRSHNFTSCNRCRSRRRRCDGVAPSRATVEEPTRPCSSCMRSKEECTWPGGQDRRLPPSSQLVERLRTRVSTLQQRIRTYERRLRENGHSIDFEALHDNSDSDALSDGEVSDVDDMTISLGNLVIDSSATAYYGGPAPFRDLPSTQEKFGLIKDTSPPLKANEEPLGIRPSLAPDRPEIFRPDLAQSLHNHSDRLLEFGPNVSPPYDNNIRYELCKSINDVTALDPQSASAWLSFLPSDTASILSRLEHDLVLSRYFRYYCSWSYPVIPNLFLRDFALATSPNSGSNAPPPLRHYSALFHNAILSVALAYSDNVHLRSREIRDRFAKHAKSFLEAEGRAPALSTVQGLAILSSYHSGLSEQALGFMYFGVSVQMGQALGLDVGVQGVDMSNQAVVERNWVFWSLFCQDKCWSLFVGRDQGVRVRRFEIPEPELDPVLPGDYSIPDTDASEGKTDATPVSQPSSGAENFLWQVKLMKISSSILDVVYGMAGVIRRGIDLAQADQLRLDLLSWERALPRHLHIPLKTLSTCSSPPGVFMLNMAFHWLLILLLSPFFKPHIKIPTPATSSLGPSLDGTPARPRDFVLSKLRNAALNECPSSATYIVSLFGAYRRLHTLRLSNVTAIQVVYTAGKTHLVTILAGDLNPSAEGMKVREEFLECVQIMKEIGETWTSARVMADLLQALLLRNEGRIPQRMTPTLPRVDGRYDPSPYPAPTRSPGIALSAAGIHFSGFGLAIGNPQAPEGPSSLDHPSDSSMLRMDSPTPDYEGSSRPFSNSPSSDHHGASNLWASQGPQEEDQTPGSGRSPSAGSGAMPTPLHAEAPPRLFPDTLHSSASPGHIWPDGFFSSSSVPVNPAWMPDGSTFPDQPSFDMYPSSPWLTALQASPRDENDLNEQPQASDSFFVNDLDLQDGGTAEPAWTPS